MASGSNWRSKLLGSLEGQLQLATYTAVLIGFTGATTTGLWLSNRNQIRNGEADLQANADHLNNHLVAHRHLGQGHSARDWSPTIEEEVRQALRDHSSVRTTLWIELADGRLVLPTLGPIAIPQKMMRATMQAHKQDPKTRLISVEDADYLTLLGRSYPTGERLWSSAKAINSGRIQNEFLGWMIAIGVGSMLLSLITITVMVRRIVRPLLHLSERSAALTADTLNQDPIPEMTAAPKEVRQLARTYSELMERLALSWNDQQRFVSAVSHELRTPLTIVQGYLHRTIKRSNGLSDDERRGLKTAEEESIRMRMLLDDLLDLSRGDSGQLQLNQEVVDLGPLVEKVADLSQSNLTDRRLEVLNNIPIDENSEALADPGRLQQVLLDLIDNAAKYSAEDSLISLILYPHPNGIVIDVKDEGIGIPESDLPHIFKRFHRAKNSSGSSGTGLGLSVVALLMSAMGGKVHVQSKEGEGSCFSVILPKPTSTASAT
ncbi:sensor histidine kinase KdpD [Synechococcus sp. ROS8604]|uniref:sensor histidine kinase n=1 Tax=Synechococcus sp. ROS8604 TaxID=1442557 RepID=UPI001645CEF1|nr:HAMP domain-containing sensor histidine kinase [Synechococcus sp. ROS8604]QNI87552.1 two-component system sensor histidine kinase [Synechococcus sp. ROS8604]